MKNLYYKIGVLLLAALLGLGVTDSLQAQARRIGKQGKTKAPSGSQAARAIGSTRRGEVNEITLDRSVGNTQPGAADAGGQKATSLGISPTPSAPPSVSRQVGAANAETHVSGAFFSRQIDGFVMDDRLKQEISLRAGVALPLGWSRDLGVVPEGVSIPAVGARTGCGIAFSYRFYPIPYFFLGAHLDYTYLDYDFSGFTISGDASARKVGWNAVALALVVGARMPLGIYGLYFSPHAGIGYGMMVSPSLREVYEVAAPTLSNPDRTVSRSRTILSTDINAYFYLSGGISVEYRFLQRWIAKVFFDYNYMPSRALGSDQVVAGANASGTKPKQQLSVITVGLGINYAF